MNNKNERKYKNERITEMKEENWKNEIDDKKVKS